MSDTLSDLLQGPPAIVQSVHAAAVREINALEVRIVQAEDDADAQLWEQARQVVAQLEAGLSQRELARQWINARTGEPYSQMHVSFTARVFAEKYTFQPRPRFRDAYNAIANPPKAAKVAADTPPADPNPFRRWLHTAETLIRVRDQKLYEKWYPTFEAYLLSGFCQTDEQVQDVTKRLADPVHLSTAYTMAQLYDLVPSLVYGNVGLPKCPDDLPFETYVKVWKLLTALPGVAAEMAEAEQWGGKRGRRHERAA